MEFGPEINEDRPTWLDDDEIVLVKWTYPDGWSGNRNMKAKHQKHSPWVAFRLPANHPHYTTPTPDERAVAPELVARLVALARSVATSPACTILQTVEAQNILAALEPVDPDKEIIRQMRLEWAKGDEDVDSMLLRVLKRGRQLEKEGK